MTPKSSAEGGPTDWKGKAHLIGRRGVRLVGTSAGRIRRHRQTLLRVLAGITAAIATLFATVGDGVPDGQVGGFEGVVLDYFHTAVWVLLTAAFLVASVERRSIRRFAGPIAVTAGLFYLVFTISLHRHS